MCLDSWSSLSGVCCTNTLTYEGIDLTSAITPQEIAPQYCTKPFKSSSLCSDKVKGNARYGFCPFEIDKCYAKPIISAKSSLREIGATTINFKNKDVCSWKLKASESEIYFTRNFNITTEVMYDVDCFLVFGPSLDKMD